MRITRWVNVGVWFLLIALICLPLQPLFAMVLQAAADSGATAPGGKAEFIVGTAALGAFLAETIGTFVLNLWNKAGNFLDGKSNGLKMALALFVTGALGLLFGLISEQLTHNANWVVTLGLSVAAGVVQIVKTGMTIDTVKSKLTSAEKNSIAGR